ncbi:MAG: hypothetical protein R3E13_00895 [Alphaproteobacteria bacterium]
MAFEAIRKAAYTVIGIAATPIIVGMASALGRGVVASDSSFEGDKTAFVVDGAISDATLTFHAAKDTLILVPNAIGCATKAEAPYMDKIQSRLPNGEKYSKSDCLTAVALEWVEDLSAAWREYSKDETPETNLRWDYNQSSGAKPQGYGNAPAQSLEVNGQKYESGFNLPRYSV